jgi:hypothetical protein
MAERTTAPARGGGGNSGNGGSTARTTPTRRAGRDRYRVLKTLRPDDRGAIDLARRYGSALVCVRHRVDARGKVRHVTVELVIDSVPIRPRSRPLVHLHVRPQDRAIASMITAAGGRWHEPTSTWLLPRRVANILNLRNHIVTP